MRNWKEIWNDIDWDEAIDVTGGTTWESGEDYVFDGKRKVSFPTVRIELFPTTLLKQIADVCADEECSCYVELNGHSKTRIDDHILVFADNEPIRIDLDEDDQKAVYAALNRQFKYMIGLGCKDLLKQAEGRMR